MDQRAIFRAIADAHGADWEDIDEQTAVITEHHDDGSMTKNYLIMPTPQNGAAA
ncbi:hypothetical protein [Nocardia sp. IFM 10818]